MRRTVSRAPSDAARAVGDGDGAGPVRSSGTASATQARQDGGPAGEAGPKGPEPRAHDEHLDPGDVEAALSMVLVRRAQDGDGDAFAELYDRYVDTVYRYALYRVRSRQLAEDITSETFTRGLRSLESFTWQGRDVGAWFVTIARNLISDHYKSSRYRLELTTDDVGALGGVPLEQGPEDQVMTGLQADEVLDAVRRLGAEQQECVVLRFLQGLSVAETARVLGKNETAVKAMQHRAVRTLGRLMRESPEARDRQPEQGS